MQFVASEKENWSLWCLSYICKLRYQSKVCTHLMQFFLTFLAFYAADGYRSKEKTCNVNSHANEIKDIKFIVSKLLTSSVYYMVSEPVSKFVL